MISVQCQMEPGNLLKVKRKNCLKIAFSRQLLHCIYPFYECSKEYKFVSEVSACARLLDKIRVDTLIPQHDNLCAN